MTTESGSNAGQSLEKGGVFAIPRYVGLMTFFFPISLLTTAVAAFFVTVAFLLTGGPIAELTTLVIFGYAIIISHYNILDEGSTDAREYGAVVSTIKSLLIMLYFHAAVFVAVTLSYSVYLAGYPTVAIFVAMWYPGFEVITARRNIPFNLLMGYALLDWIVETIADRSSEFSVDDWKQRYEEATTTISHTTLRFSESPRTSMN